MAHRRKGNINSFTYLACLVVMAARARDANRLLRVLQFPLRACAHSPAPRRQRSPFVDSLLVFAFGVRARR